MLTAATSTLWSLAQPAPVLVLAFRRFAAAGLDDLATRTLIAGQFGRDHVRVLVLAQLLLARITDGATRRVTLGAPCCLCVAADELAMIDAITAAARGDDTVAHAALDDFVAPEHVGSVASIAAALGEAVRDAGQPLRPRLEARRPTLH